MKGFLKRFCRKFESVYLAAVLVTFLQAGQAANAMVPNWGDETAGNVSGAVSRPDADEYHLYLNLSLQDVKGGDVFMSFSQWQTNYEGIYGDIGRGIGFALELELTTEQEAVNCFLDESAGKSFLISTMQEGQGPGLVSISNLSDSGGLSYDGQINVQTKIIPEPMTVGLFGMIGMIDVALRRRRP